MACCCQGVPNGDSRPYWNQHWTNKILPDCRHEEICRHCRYRSFHQWHPSVPRDHLPAYGELVYHSAKFDESSAQNICFRGSFASTIKGAFEGRPAVLLVSQFIIGYYSRLNLWKSHGDNWSPHAHCTISRSATHRLQDSTHFTKPCFGERYGLQGIPASQARWLHGCQ